MAMMRRKKILVDRGLQLRFARIVMMFVFIASLFTSGAIFLTTFMLMGEKLANVYPQARLVEIFRSVYLWALVSFVSTLPFIYWGSIKFSHRIAGPLPKIYQFIKNVGDGNYDLRLTLRRYDELRELADHLNEMVKKLREREKKV